jgi:hypothetical protein
MDGDTDIFIHDSYFIVQVPCWLVATVAVAAVIGAALALAFLWRLWRGRWPWR